MNKYSKSYKVFTAFNWLLMLGIIVVCVFPYLHTLAKALNDGYDTMLGGITIYPRKLTWQNFTALFQDVSMFRAFGVSVLRVVLTVVLCIIVQFAAAYALSRSQMRGRNQILLFLAIPMFFNGGMIPQYLLYVKCGLINNFWVYILPGLFSYYNMIVMKSFIDSSIPDSLPEAASLDGASEFRILWQIVFPLCKPVLATVALWLAVGAWNAWTDTMYYITDPELHTLQYKLMELVRESERLKALIQEAALAGEELGEEVKSTPESMVSAQVIVTTIPIIILYPFLQKYFVKGVTLGAVK
ncbi:MAG: carbohydrate ABC transporter permease [Clostridia bacterium]|nr:carbohydrate ABC transporter permease [Clostridia bacterium]